MSQPDADFRHVPVEMARQIGQDCNKDQVIVLSFDESCGMLSTATWGRAPEDKLAAARAGDSLAAVCGADFLRKLPNADFRDIPAAERAAEIERCLLKLKAAVDLIAFWRERLAGEQPSEWATKWGRKFPELTDSWLAQAQAWLAELPPGLAPAAPAVTL